MFFTHFEILRKSLFKALLPFSVLLANNVFRFLVVQVLLKEWLLLFGEVLVLMNVFKFLYYFEILVLMNILSCILVIFESFSFDEYYSFLLFLYFL